VILTLFPRQKAWLPDDLKDKLGGVFGCLALVVLFVLPLGIIGMV